MTWQEQTTITTTWSGGKVITTVWSEESSSTEGEPLYYSDGSPVIGRDGQQIRVKST